MSPALSALSRLHLLCGNLVAQVAKTGSKRCHAGLQGLPYLRLVDQNGLHSLELDSKPYRGG